MKNVLIDTDTILDFFLARRPFDKEATEIFKLAYSKEILSSVTVLSYANAYYFIRKFTDKKRALELLKYLKKIVHTINVDENILENALNSDFTDFEDALQYYCAKSMPAIEIIITRNIKDFNKSKIPVYTPKRFLNQFFPNHE